MSSEAKIKELGLKIFKSLSKSDRSILQKKFYYEKLLQWTMSRPDLKSGLFRLVDVLPALNDSRSIARHIKEYLHEPLRDLNTSGKILTGIMNSGLLPDSLSAFSLNLGVNEMAGMFIAGKDARQANPLVKEILKDRMGFTMDLLGEYAVCEEESEQYLTRYLQALKDLQKNSLNWPVNWSAFDNHPGCKSKVCISVKLSALYSQTNVLNFDKSVSTLADRLMLIMREAKKTAATLYVDAEDCSSNPIIYAAVKKAFAAEEFRDFYLPGIVLQAYAKSSEQTLWEFLDFAKTINNRLAIRLVKGAYWDHETVNSSYNQLPNPLFTEKAESDRNYEKLSRILLDNHKLCYPAFGSHNIRSLSQACIYAESIGLTKNDFELQMLFGMARPIARAFRDQGYFVRLYVPLGELLPGMGYFVRRLLENTSNESFLRHTFLEGAEAEKLLGAP